MGLIPKTDIPSPAFVHVDVDDLWAIAECYGISVDANWAHYVALDALPRFKSLFEEAGISATFFLVGKDLEDPQYVRTMRQMLDAGHQVANHSYSHSLRFRALAEVDMALEIDTAHDLISKELGIHPRGFRAPGYAWNPLLLKLLEERGYQYDGSLMPGPYGGIFRWLDGTLQADGASPPIPKTQYPLVRDTFHSLYPGPVGRGSLIEIPSATSPLLRLPFQAGVCMRLGYGYFRACFEIYRWNKALPFVFLFHAADLADFSKVPHTFFQRSKFFNTPVQYRVNLASRFLATIAASRPIVSTENWLS